VVTASGSLYEIHEHEGGGWVLTAENVPSEASADLRGMRLPMLQPEPWPAIVGFPLMLVIELPDWTKIRQTSPVVCVTGPVPGTEA